MKKQYSQKWQVYFILLLQNVPLFIPREKSNKVGSGNKRVASAFRSAALALAVCGGLNFDYKIK